MDYRNFKGQDSITISSDLTHVFKVDDNTVYMKGRLSGYEHLPPVSVPFRRFLSRLTCWAPAQRRSLGAKIARKLPAHRCFAVSAEQILAEARRRPQGILLYFQGLQRSISPNLPAKTGRGSNPLSLRKLVTRQFQGKNLQSFLTRKRIPACSLK